MKRKMGSNGFNKFVKEICEYAELKESKELTELKHRLDIIESDLTVIKKLRVNKSNRSNRLFDKNRSENICQYCKGLYKLGFWPIETKIHKKCKYIFTHDETRKANGNSWSGQCKDFICILNHENEGYTDFNLCIECIKRTNSS